MNSTSVINPSTNTPDLSFQASHKEKTETSVTSFPRRVENAVQQLKETSIISADAFRRDENGIYHFHPEETKLIFPHLYDALQKHIRERGIKVVYMMIGPPGSGKTTYLAGMPTLKPDSAFLEGTYTMNRDRKTAIEKIREANPEISIKGVVMMTSATECIARSKKRSDEKPGKEPRIPERTITLMHQSLHGKNKRHTPPSLSEGFSSITNVSGDGEAKEVIVGFEALKV